MPNYTTNLGLEKPLGDEQYNIDVFNANADKIDQFAGQVPARALTADKLTTGAKINGVNFKGDSNITLPTVNTSGNQTVGGVKTFSEVIQGTIANAQNATNDGNGDKIDETYIKTADLADKWHALKGYEDAGELLYDAEGLADVTNYAHSTFDRSKFTIVGSPNITDDGVVSGFSASNYVSLPSSYTLGTDFEVYLPFILSDLTTETQIYRLMSGNTFRGLLTFVPASGIQVNMSDGTHSMSSGGNKYVIQTSDLTANELYIAVIKLKNQTCHYGCIHNGVYTEAGTIENFALDMPEFDTVFIGKGNLSAFTGSIDLKYFKFVANGVELISGNKTDIDTYTIGGNTVSVPYTLSKTGSKIVNSVYRTQVTAVYNEYGYANYYTLSDTDFTLPQGELYGLIGRLQKLVDDEIGLPKATLSNTLNDNEIWLEGAEVSKLTYSKLYAIYGDDYGTPTDSANFVLPDFRDRVMQGIGSGGTFGYISAGLPDITGKAEIGGGGASSPICISSTSGAFGTDTTGTVMQRSETSSNKDHKLTLNASNSNSIYGNSTTVQPPAIKVRFKTRFQ